MERRTFLKSIGVAGAMMSALPLNVFCQDLPPLSPAYGGRSILPAALQAGDILVSTTPHLVSRIIQHETHLPISHAAIVYDVTNAKNPLIMEAVGKGVHSVDYDYIMKEDTLCVALRKRTLTSNEVKKLQDWLISKLGADYDFGGVFTEWIKLKVKFLNKIRSLDFGSPEKFFCSELVREAHKQSTGIDLIQYKGEAPGISAAPGRFVEMQWFDQLDYVGHLKYPM